MPPELRDEGAAFRVEDEVGRALDVRPLAEILALGAEDLDAIVLAVADEDPAVGGHGDAVGEIELAGPGSRDAPGALALARRREAVDAAIAIAVADVEIALGPDGQVGRAIERIRRLRDRHVVLAVIARVRGGVRRAERHEQLAFRREATHRVVSVVGAPHRAVRGGGDAVGAVGEIPLAPGADEVALAVVHDDGVITAADQEDAVLAVDRHPRHVAMLVARRKLLPALDHSVGQPARRRHDAPLAHSLLASQHCARSRPAAGPRLLFEPSAALARREREHTAAGPARLADIPLPSGERAAVRAETLP